MSTLEPVDGIDVQIIVDNVTDSLSSVPSFVETELAALDRRRRGAWFWVATACAARRMACPA